MITPHPPGFVQQGNHLIFPTAGRTFAPIWTTREVSAEYLSRGELAEARRLAPCYLTPKSGTMGWNVRSSFPEQSTRRGLPFIRVSDDGITFVQYQQTHGQIEVSA